ncbi:AMP-binding protein, partial [bacterium]|nr:AMP-binding protein [bacterium]
KEGCSLSEDALLEFAKTKLATYKLPRVVEFADVMRNPTGKLMKPQMREKYTGRKEAFQSLV